MINMHSKYRLHLLFLWGGKNGDERVPVDMHCCILPGIDDESLDMDICLSMQ